MNQQNSVDQSFDQLGGGKVLNKTQQDNKNSTLNTTLGSKKPSKAMKAILGVHGLPKYGGGPLSDMDDMFMMHIPSDVSITNPTNF